MCILWQVATRLNLPEAGELALAEDVYGPFSGQVSSAARQALRRAVAEAHPLLVEAMLLCELSSTSDVLSGACTTPSLPSPFGIVKEDECCESSTRCLPPHLGTPAVA